MGKKRKEALILSIKPNTGGLEAREQLKQHILVTGDFGNKDPRELKKRDLFQNFSKDTFDQELQKMDVNLDIKVDDALSGQGKLAVRGKIRSINDFEPDSLADENKFRVGGDGNGEEGPKNALNEAMLLRSALHELSERLDEGDSGADAFFNMVSEIAGKVSAEPDKYHNAVTELKKGDLLRTLQMGAPQED